MAGIRLSGINSGLDTESIVQSLVSAYSTKKDSLKKEQTKLSWTQDAWKSLNTKVYGFYTNISNMRFSSAYNLKKTSVSDATKASVTAGSSTVNGSQKLNIIRLAQAGYLTGDELGEDVKSDTKMSELGFTKDEATIQITRGDGEASEITIKSSDTIKDVLSKLQEEGLNASYDEKNRRIFVSAKESGEKSDFNLTGADEDANNLLDVLGLSSDKATKLDGQDALIKLNKVEYTSATNSIEVNGLTVNALAVTGDGDENAITITTATDTQGIYDKIKDFLTEYNSLINEITKLYNADSAKGYEPLTDDEKDAMSEKEVEKWEEKIKDSLLRHDSTLSGVMNAMTLSMSKGITINGKSYSLSSFGISTLGVLNAAKNEQNAYHIDGDEDDSNSSGKTDKLMAAINSDPDTVMEFFQKLSTNLYDAIGDKMKSTTLSSVYTIYNDKQMEKQYTNYTKLIAEWETRVSDKEEYYYKKFTAMEKALASLNSTQSSIGSYFGS